jgi:hypothetical protein
VLTRMGIAEQTLKQQAEGMVAMAKEGRKGKRKGWDGKIRDQEDKGKETKGRMKGRARGLIQLQNRKPKQEISKMRILDVDRIPLHMLHQSFMYTMVRRLPAEKCVQVVSRIGQFRDKQSQACYESLLRDCGKLFGPVYGAELLALFTRCHQTLSIPFALDYVRKFGEFSRAYIAKKVAKSMQVRLFDFSRYTHKGGVRPLPLIVTRPWSLNSYAGLLRPSSARRYIYNQLKIHGQIPIFDSTAQDERGNMALPARFTESMIEAGRKRVGSGKNDDEVMERPPLLEAIMAAEYTGQSLEDVLEGMEKEKERHMMDGDYDEEEDEDLGDMEEADFVDDEDEIFSDDEVDDDDRQDLKALLIDETPVHRFRAPRVGKMSMQFEKVAPVLSNKYSSPKPEDGAVIDPREEPANYANNAVVPRHWKVVRRRFFRHDRKAYRLTAGGWKQVQDPRGETPKPKRRHLPQHERIRRMKIQREAERRAKESMGIKG